MNKDKEFKAWEVVGTAEGLAARVAANFPEDLAKTLRRWEPDKIAPLIEALQKEQEIIDAVRKEGK